MTDREKVASRADLSEEADFFSIRQPMNLMLGFSNFLPVKNAAQPSSQLFTMPSRF